MKRRILNLQCCCCAGSARGRQWYNRDRGYGVCKRCADWVKSGGASDEEMRRDYGVRGEHYAIKEES